MRLGVERLGPIAIADDALLLHERLARERLVVGLERQLGALRPLVGLGVELLDLLLELLLRGEGGDDLLLREDRLLLHLLDDELQALFRVVGAVEQGVHVARDHAAHAVEDAHGEKV